MMNGMVKYKVIMWCGDCYQEDSQGCFEGGLWDSQRELDLIFDTKEAAEKYGKKQTNGPPWEYEIKEVVNDG